MAGYWKVDHKDYWGIVWGGIIYLTPQDIRERWQQIFGEDDIDVSPCSKEDAKDYEAIGLKIIDLEDEVWNG